MTRSRHVDRFNHDTEVHGYDEHVADESNPVRNGYDATLDWVIEQAAVDRDDVVVELGTGTGNLAARLGPHARLVCVDVSHDMLEVARRKLPADTEYVELDFLEFVDSAPECDTVITTYALHHLTANEKIALLDGLFLRLKPGGRIAVGDLMVAERAAVAEVRRALAHPDVDELFADEFPWFVDDGRRYLEALGFVEVRAEQTGVLSWGIAATKP